MPETLSHDELLTAWDLLSHEDRVEGFTLLSRAEAEQVFRLLNARQQLELLADLTPNERRLWVRSLPPDDAADLVQAAEADQRPDLLELLDPVARKEVNALLAYAEDEAGGLMNPRYARLRPEMTVDEAISYIRRQSRSQLESVYYAYVADAEQRLCGVVSLRDLLTSPPQTQVRSVMKTEVVTIPEGMDQEAVSVIFAQHNLMALPVVDEQGRMKGIVTADDIVDVVREEATEDIQKMGGATALEAPYLAVGVREMIGKRLGWLVILFLGQTLTITVMTFFEAQLSAAEVLALFIPLILSSGGNSGSQAAAILVRALALNEVRLREWWSVMRTEVLVGIALGAALGLLGLARILLWHTFVHSYGEHVTRIAFTVAFSLVGVVLWGTLTGSMLPILLKRLGFDPASASTPFVATLVDVTGLLIYFCIAILLLRGHLL